MKLILDTGEVYNMVPADNQDKLENDIQLYVGGVRYVGELVNDKGFYIDHSKTKIGIRCFNEDGIFKDIYFYNKNNNNHDQSKNRRNSIPKRTQT